MGLENKMEWVNVLCTLRFTDAQLDKLRAVSPRLHVEQKTCRSAKEVTTALTPETQVLYTFYAAFDPADYPGLKWVQLHTAGVNHVLDTPLMRSDVPVTTTSGIHAPRIAEYAFASMLAFTYRVPTMLRFQGRGEWPTGRWDIFSGHELRGQTVGIVGYGSIGREVARLADAFAMRVLVSKRYTGEMTDDGYSLAGVGDLAGMLPDGVYGPDRLHDMLRQCDFVVVAAPLTQETHHMIDEAALRAMRPNAYLVNVARGGLIDEVALARALRKGWIAGAGLDVFEKEPLPADSPLWEQDNVILSPHVAGFSLKYDERATDLFAQNLNRFLAGKPLLNLVDRGKGY
jgi:phosphoglycerate dehydrogenase-like enzyme